MTNHVAIGWRNDIAETGRFWASGTSVFENDHPASHAATYTTFDYAETTAAAADNIAMRMTSTQQTAQDLGLSDPTSYCPGYVAIAAHNAKGMDVEFERLDQDIPGGVFMDRPNSEPIGIVIPENSKEAGTIWGVRILRANGERLRVGVFAVGPVLRIPREIYSGHRPIRWADANTIRPSLSRSGHFLGAAIERRGRRGSLRIDNISRDFLRTEDFQAFLVHARTKPFFLWWRPEEYPEEVEYCWLTRPIQAVNQRGGFVRLDLRVRAYAA